MLDDSVVSYSLSKARRPKKVLIATPSYDGRLDVWYVNALLNTTMLAQEKNIHVMPVFMSYDALIQRARNDLFRIAVDSGVDDMIFIDSDMEWNPEWIIEMVSRSEDIVGGTARKKTDDAEIYVAKTKDLTIHSNGLIKCEGLGTGFVKISRKAFMALWESSPEYQNEGKSCRMICDVQIVDGQLYSEDTVLFKKLNDLGFDCWLDPKMTCAHIGTKKFCGNMSDFIKRLENK